MSIVTTFFGWREYFFCTHTQPLGPIPTWMLHYVAIWPMFIYLFSFCDFINNLDMHCCMRYELVVS